VSSIADRLRGIVRGDGGKSSGGFDRLHAEGASARLAEAGEDISRAEAEEHDPPCEDASDAGTRRRGSAVMDPGALLDGEWRQAGSHRFLVIERSYAPGYRHGSMSVADGLPPCDGWSRLELLAGTACRGQLLFMDLETTGLAGGAGSYAFLVGCGWFGDGRFHVRQFLLSSFASERALLEAVRDMAGDGDIVVTYNGKTFDLPLIETRYTLNRLATPFAEMPHVDMLHHARRFWHASDQGHRLTSLESSLFGYEREGDVPGFEIPARYFHFVHTGDARPLGGVLEHNRLDLLSLALLTARAAQLLEDGATGAATSREAFAMGRLYEHSGMTADALACFARAADMDRTVRADALHAHAILLRRLRRYEAAATIWEQLLHLEDCPLRLERDAAEALAVHHEHRLRSLQSARGLAMRSLLIDATATRREATEHRLARLDRKLARTEMPMAALF
jgi:uncharacterized protein YprB with RNaseH-like and TPR domain